MMIGIRRLLNQALQPQMLKEKKNFLHILPYPNNKLPNGAFVSALRNNRINDESEKQYEERSLQELQDTFQKHHFYIYVDKARRHPVLWPGHVACFLTDDNRKMIENSSVSLRPGKRIDGKILKFKLDFEDIERLSAVRTVRFLSIIEEFKNYLFNQAKESIDVGLDRKRFLFGMPITLREEKPEDILTAVAEVIATYKDKEYILCDGSVNDEFVKSLNCVVGFYKSVHVKGTEPNPSPQMAVWSYHKLLFGQSARNSMLKDTGFKMPEQERVHDDELTWDGDSSWKRTVAPKDN